MRFRVVNLGCKVNRVESDRFERLLSRAGQRAADGCGADIVVVNTCTVTAVAEKKTRKAVRQALSAHPRAKVVVTGCAAAQSPRTYEALSPRVEVVAKWDAEARLAALVGEAEGIADPAPAVEPPDSAAPAPAVEAADPAAPAPAEAAAFDDAPFLALGRARVGVKVQDGCANACTYCIVHAVRGPETSADPKAVVADVREAVEAGAAEVVLSGINLGRYAFGGLRLAGLLERLLAEELPCRFRLSSIEPDDVDAGLVSLLARAEGRVCRHLHLPLQSGSTRVLAEMGRRYTAGDFAALVKALRDAMPGVSLSTDVIAGFPGEDDDDFAESIALSEACGFSKMHVFPYSERAGTPAAARTDQVPPDVRHERARILREAAARLRERDLASRRGSIERAVVEDDTWCTTESYHAVRAPSGARPGSLVDVRL